jgi:hypothetical protein
VGSNGRRPHLLGRRVLMNHYFCQGPFKEWGRRFTVGGEHSAVVDEALAAGPGAVAWLAYCLCDQWGDETAAMFCAVVEDRCRTRSEGVQAASSRVPDGWRRKWDEGKEDQNLLKAGGAAS